MYTHSNQLNNLELCFLHATFSNAFNFGFNKTPNRNCYLFTFGRNFHLLNLSRKWIQKHNINIESDRIYLLQININYLNTDLLKMPRGMNYFSFSLSNTFNTLKQMVLKKCECNKNSLLSHSNWKWWLTGSCLTVNDWSEQIYSFYVGTHAAEEKSARCSCETIAATIAIRWNSMNIKACIWIAHKHIQIKYSYAKYYNIPNTYTRRTKQ